MDSGTYFYFDHTADVGVEARSPTLGGVFETAAGAVFDLLVDRRTVGLETERGVSVRGADLEEVMVRWLSELLYLHDAEGLLFCEFVVTGVSAARLDGIARGEKYDPARHQTKCEVKAVTYHEISVCEVGGQWRARIIVDV